jgi:maltose O-acetyltransferase
MNLFPVFHWLFRIGILSVVDHIVTEAERVRTDIRYEEYRDRYDVHESFLKRRNEGIKLYGEGDIRTGPGSYIGRNSRVKAGEHTTITIGNGCAFSHDVAIYSVSWVADQDFGDRHPEDFEPLAKQSGDVNIGDAVWIGYNVFVTPGTDIGSNAVIGANSVVTRDIPPECIAAGSPATVVSFKSHLSERRKRTLAEQHPDVLSEELRAALLAPGPS